jgi:hypothetical protein
MTTNPIAAETTPNLDTQETTKQDVPAPASPYTSSSISSHNDNSFVNPWAPQITPNALNAINQSPYAKDKNFIDAVHASANAPDFEDALFINKLAAEGAQKQPPNSSTNLNFNSSYLQTHFDF